MTTSRRAYSADQPISGKAQDRFNRWPFAQRIAETIANSRDPSSLVIGLYGPWGDGKTSTLAMMEEALAERSDVVVFRFNPWQFGSPEQLLRGFFDSLADALGRSLKSAKEVIGGILEKYGGILSAASVHVGHLGGGASVDAGKGAMALGKSLSSVELQELRVRLESILTESGKRVVILVDDIDRLDRSEIHAIFKLIKLSASFEHTSYVLAFDDEMVAASLGEKYGSGDVAAGRAFLEKIIQVPLHLPPADSMELRQVSFEEINAVLEQSQISLTREQIERFAVTFQSAIQDHISTPRQAKRLANAISFALPILKGEANPIDVMLVESIRVVFPKLYALVRDNPALFLTSRDYGETENQRQEKLNTVIDSALSELDLADRAVLRKRLVEVLFPRASRVGYGSEFDTIWSREQRVCSEEYFARYFSYSVPPGDVGDLEVQSLVDELRAGSLKPDQISARLGEFARRRAMPRFLDKLRRQEDTFDQEAARRIIVGLAPNGGLFPKEEGPWMFRTSFMQGAILIRKLLKRLTANQREALAIEVVKAAEPLPFAFECHRWMRVLKGEAEGDRIMSPESEATVGRALVARIRETAVKSPPIYEIFDRDAPALLWMWKEFGPEGEMEACLRKRLLESPHEIGQFLGTFVGRNWGMESGTSRRSEFTRNAYDRVVDLIGPAFIVERIREQYGEEILSEGQESPDEEVTSEEELKHQDARTFIRIHDYVQKENQRVVVGEQPPESAAVTEGPSEGNTSPRASGAQLESEKNRSGQAGGGGRRIVGGKKQGRRKKSE